jgi:cephalosporin hydroxylase
VSGAEIVTVDLAVTDPRDVDPDLPIVFMRGDSVDPGLAADIEKWVGDRRAMVVLDSDHSAEHVAREIELYGPLVSPGCYLVVEDTVYGYSDEAKVRDGMGEVVGSPLDAVARMLAGNPAWSRDIAIEHADPVSSNPAGWWIKNA